jgi:RNA polymerase sigma factor (sigma-70 family)
VTADLVDLARAGDEEAFRQLLEPYRRELEVHCYRMLGSFTDAEDAMQEVLLAAWQGMNGFEGRSSIRTWLYRIATTRCLNARRSSRRSPRTRGEVRGARDDIASVHHRGPAGAATAARRADPA